MLQLARLFLLIVAFLAFAPATALAQNFDANTQITIESISPTYRTLRPDKEDEEIIEPRLVSRKIRDLPPAQQTIELKKLEDERKQSPFMALWHRDARSDLEREVLVKNPKAGQKKTTKKAGTPELAAWAGVSYDSNVAKSRVNSLSDQIAAFGASATLRVPTNEAKTQTLTVIGKVDAFRYSTYKTRDADALFFQVSHGYTVSSRPVLAGIDIKTTHSLIVGFENSTAFGSGFEPWTGTRNSPFLRYQIASIPLARDTCTVNENTVFCLYATARFTLYKNMLSAAFQDHTSFRMEPSITWITPVNGLILGLTAAATPRNFHEAIGGRRDVIYEIAPSFEYYVDSTTILSGTFRYLRAVSNPGTFDWSGFVASPQLKLTKTF